MGQTTFRNITEWVMFTSWIICGIVSWFWHLERLYPMTLADWIYSMIFAILCITLTSLVFVYLVEIAISVCGFIRVVYSIIQSPFSLVNVTGTPSLSS